MKKAIYKILLKPRTTILLLSLIMVLTTAVSFVYWKSGISGNQANRTLSVQVGTGTAIETTVSLGDIAGVSGKLIPYNRTPETGEINKIEFDIDVTWVSGATGSDLDNFKDHTGQLTASCASITLDGVEIKDMDGLGGKLFVVSFANAVSPINGDETVTVRVTITMNEPANKADYELVADSTVIFKFNFLIESGFELNS